MEVGSEVRGRIVAAAEAVELEEAGRQLALAMERAEAAERMQQDRERELAASEAKAEMRVAKAVERHKEVSIRLDGALRELEEVRRESAEAVRRAERAAGEAREHAAGIGGQLEAMAAQNRELLQALRG